MQAVARFLPSRPTDPVLTGVLLTASADGLVLAGTDRERAVRLSCPATVHTEGTVLVPGRPLAETLRALDDDLVQVAVEGSRLAVRTSRARFALPLLDVDVHPGVAQPPPLVGRVTGDLALPALVSVAGAASRDDALPLFTGVRIRANGDVLRLVATDRYRLALAELPWQGVGEPFSVPGGPTVARFRATGNAPPRAGRPSRASRRNGPGAREPARHVSSRQLAPCG